MPDNPNAFIGAPADDPAFRAVSWAVEVPFGEPIHAYARPLSREQALEFDRRLDEIEPAHAKAAARMHTLFAG